MTAQETLPRFGHLAQRLFNVPLVIHPRKAEVVLAALAERLGITHIQRTDGVVIVPMAFKEDDEFTLPSRGGEPHAGYDVVNGVAIIEVTGTLVQKLGTVRPYSGMSGYDGIRQNFMMAMDDPAVRAVVFDVDSPGGEVAGCFDLVDAIYEARGTKPIHSILTENAYSGGYAIASAADKVWVPRTGGVGSIGVICLHADFSKAIKNAGIEVTILQYGDYKADGRPEIPLTAAAEKRFMADINAMGELFDETAGRNRAMSPSKIKSYQAGSFMGKAAVEAGLADAVIPPDAAFRDIVESIGNLGAI